ncbi:MAG: hypothetical protein JSS69_16075 [Acidobacteria bacterium]|nr:hypothetical protein [Acidobacteriota bacterium]MBS1867432.1 hypothetical protein [Acidobacteriota bacterium]
MRRTTKWLALFPLVLAALLALPQFSFAQGDRDDRDNDDPPSRAARLSYTGGPVSFQPAGTDDWVSIVANRPVTTGDKLWTDKGGRAELRFGSSAVRIGGETGFSFLNLDDRTAQIRLTEGSINVRVKRLDEDENIEIDTPNLAFTVLRPGSYRVTVNEAGDTTFVKVRGGDGEVTGAGSAYAIHADQSGTFSGFDQLSADIEDYGGDDDFDQWCSERDRRWDRSNSARYVSDDVVGYEDLDDYGGWRPVSEYGTVWFPHTTVVGWAPYRYGHWAYVAPWGWTWVDDAPWGFAPFHYGRWVVVGGVWGWVPVAPRPAFVTVAYVRPVYAPALVAWVGGAHWGVGVAVGGPPAVGVAWFPLGPRDVYCPSYHVSQRYVQNVNISNTTIINRTQVTNVYNNVYVNKTVNVTNITYQNQHINNAVTATSQASFTSAQPVAKNMVRVDAREVSAAPVAPTGPAVVPQQRSVLGAGATSNIRPTGAAAFANRPVVAKTTPPPAPISFARQQQAIQANGGRPIAVSQERQLQTQTTRPNVRIAPPARQVTPQVQNGVQNRPNNRPNQPVQTNPQVQQKPAVQNQPPANPNRPSYTNDNVQNNSQDNGRGNGSNRQYNDRPPISRPTVNPQLEQQHQQQLDSLRQQQDRERQKVEQQQVQEQQKLQQRQSDDRAKQQAQEKQQKQLEQLEQKHDRQQQQLEQKQQKDEQKSRGENKPPKQPKNEPKNNDRPPHPR